MTVILADGKVVRPYKKDGYYELRFTFELRDRYCGPLADAVLGKKYRAYTTHQEADKVLRSWAIKHPDRVVRTIPAILNKTKGVKA